MHQVIFIENLIQEVGSKFKLSTRKYKPIIALDDEAEVDWTSYIFTSLLESVHRYHIVRKSNNFCNEVHFSLLVNYLLEQKMPREDTGEELADSDFLP